MNQTLKAFIIYARADRDTATDLKEHLRPLIRKSKISIWDDGEIVAGEKWDQRIKEQLGKADIILMLISKDFFNSEYIETVELERALQQHKEGRSIIIPIIAQPCFWQEDFAIQQFQVLPKEGKPVHSQEWHSVAEALTNVVQGINKTIVQLSQKKALAKIIPQLLFVKGGTFQMGSNNRDNEKPIHKVQLDDFKIGKYLITVGEYLAFVEATNSHHPAWMEAGNPRNIKTGTDDLYKKIGTALTNKRCPMVGISWYNAIAYCNWLSQQQGLEPVYRKEGEKVSINSAAKGYRLPTEAEWEYAARGGQQSKGYLFSGSNTLDEVGWYWENSGDKRLSGGWNLANIFENNCRTHPVGEKKPNELGLYDMSGNVWEWCQDWYAADYYKNSPTKNPLGSEISKLIVLRGGSWSSVDLYCRVSNRNWSLPNGRSDNYGVRLVEGC